ncbi:MAG: hypothetical protein K0B05_03395 [Bacteroidales bacterium]|nr:hypothetical protein [Bacteroidales bacterium]
MKTTEIILLVSLFLVAGLMLYKKYGSKKQPGKSTAGSGGNLFHAPAKDDDYEPYSGRKG